MPEALGQYLLVRFATPSPTQRQTVDSNSLPVAEFATATTTPMSPVTTRTSPTPPKSGSSQHVQTVARSDMRSGTPPRKSGPFVLPPRPGTSRVAVETPGKAAGALEDGLLLLNLDGEPQTLSSSFSKGRPALPLSLADKTLLDLSDEEFEASKSSSPVRELSSRVGIRLGGCSPLRERAALLIDVSGSFEAGPQPSRASSPEELVGLVLSGSSSPGKEARKRVSFAPLGMENPTIKPVGLGDAKPQKRETTLHNKTVTPDSDVKALSGEEKENSPKQKTTVTTPGLVGSSTAGGCVAVGQPDAGEVHADFSGVWTASIDYQWHISSDWSDFDQLMVLESPIPVRLRNGETLIATQGGACHSRFRVGSKLKGFNMNEALYLPKFDGKVIALWRLAASGFQIEVAEDRVDISKGGVLGAQALRIGDRFVFTSAEEIEEQRVWEESLRVDGVSGFKKIVRRSKEEREKERKRREEERKVREEEDDDEDDEE
ncbi:hypothetical protein TWF281_001561 [Arthrobotrys megalospora]